MTYHSKYRANFDLPAMIEISLEVLLIVEDSVKAVRLHWSLFENSFS